MKIIKIILMLLVTLLTTLAYSQGEEGVSISAEPTTADPSAILDISSNNKGVLLPRISIDNVNNIKFGTEDDEVIASPADGLLVFNTNIDITNGRGKGYYYWHKISATLGQWIKLGTTSFMPHVTFIQMIQMSPFLENEQAGLFVYVTDTDAIYPNVTTEDGPGFLYFNNSLGVWYLTHEVWCGDRLYWTHMGVNELNTRSLLALPDAPCE